MRLDWDDQKKTVVQTEAKRYLDAEQSSSGTVTL
jgi:hypothetical protein